jgi:hypothetical protein
MSSVGIQIRIATEKTEWIFCGPSSALSVVVARSEANQLRVAIVESAGESEGLKSFLGGVWHHDETVLYRVNKVKEGKDAIRVTIDFSPSYAYDKLYLKIKAVSPTDGIKLLERVIVVNNSPYMDFKDKTAVFTIDELKLTKDGSYYIQVTHEMPTGRLNGIEKIRFEMVNSGSIIRNPG